MDINPIKTVGMTSRDGATEAVPVYQSPRDEFIPPLIAAFSGGSTMGDLQGCRNGILLLAAMGIVAFTDGKFFWHLREFNLSTNLDTTKEAEELQWDLEEAGLMSGALALGLFPVFLGFGAGLPTSLLSSVFLASPPGWAWYAKRTWDNCGKPGSGLAKKISEKVKDWTATPESDPATELTFVPTRLPRMAPEVVTAATGLTLGTLLLYLAAPEAGLANAMIVYPSSSTIF